MDGADNQPVNALSVAISDTNGVSSINIMRSGKNLCTSAVGRYYWAGGNRTNANAGSKYCGTAEMFRVKGGQKITVSLTNSGTTQSIYIAQFDRTGTYTTQIGLYGTDRAATLDVDTAYIAVSVQNADGYSGDATVSQLQVEYGETATDYEAATEQTVTVALGRTVTSGTLDVVNGKLTTGGSTYDVTPAEVKTLLGENNVFADCGTVWLSHKCDATLVYEAQAARIAALES